MSNIVDEDNLNAVKFDLTQLTEQVRLKSETCKNLQKQLENQKRRSQQDLDAQLQKYEKLLQTNLCRVEELTMDVTQRDMMIGELKSQLEHMIQTRMIQVNYLVAKPHVVPELGQNVHQQNNTLQSLFKIESEMDSLLIEDNINPKLFMPYN